MPFLAPNRKDLPDNSGGSGPFATLPALQTAALWRYRDR
jgi:hypothetical protein